MRFSPPLTAEALDIAGIHGVSTDLSFSENLINGLQTNLIKATIKVGVSTIVEGAPLDQTLLSALRLAVADTIGAAVATEIGNLGVLQGLNEGDIRKVIMHAALGCATGAIATNDCLAGAIGGGLQEVLGKPLSEAIGDPSAQTQVIALISGAAAALAGTDASGVGTAANVASIAHTYNYLAHVQFIELKDRLTSCNAAADMAACREAAFLEYAEISAEQEAQLAACTTDQCRAGHLAKIAAAEGMFTNLRFELMTSLSAEGVRIANLQYAGADAVVWTASQAAEFQSALRGEMVSTFCTGTVASCDISVRGQLEAWDALTTLELEQLAWDRFDILRAKEQEARDIIARDVCGDGMSVAACAGAVDDEIARRIALDNRIGGAIDIVFGAAEIVGALYMCGQSAGIACGAGASALALYGTDTLVAGTTALITGEGTMPLGARILMDGLGLDEASARLAYDLSAAGFGVATIRTLAKNTTELATAHRLFVGDEGGGFYDPHLWRQNYEDFYGGNVSSTTVPPYSAKNVQFAGQRHPVTGVIYDQRGFPIFDDIAKYDTRFSVDQFEAISYQGQMRMATRDLRDQVNINPQLRSQFDADQLQAIQSGNPNIPRLTWHHHQDSGRMQLVPRDIHSGTGHVGGASMQSGV